MTRRTEQTESLLKRKISEVIVRKLSDPRVVGMVSVTHVDLSPDFAEALVYVSILPEQYEKRSFAGLKHAAGHIGSLVSKTVDLRRMPRLEFRLDSSLKKEAAVFRDINEAMAEENARLAENETLGDDVAPPAEETDPPTEDNR